MKTRSSPPVRQFLIAAFGAVIPLAVAGVAGAQTVTPEQLMRQLEGKPLGPAQAAPPIKSRTRSFSAKEGDPVAPVQPVAVEHPQADIEIYFTTASARIVKQAEPDLDVIGRVLTDARFANMKFRIAGHTDGVGGDEYNLALSRRRADSVRRYLIEKYKISASQIEAVGFGKRQLKDAADVSSSRNRRVQVVNLSAAK